MASVTLSVLIDGLLAPEMDKIEKEAQDVLEKHFVGLGVDVSETDRDDEDEKENE